MSARHIVLVTDAWFPQPNGVVRVLSSLKRELEAVGHRITVIEPGQFHTVPLPTYSEIRLAVFPGRRVAHLLSSLRPDAIHIATEGPLGWAARAWCLKRQIPFTTAYHSKFPEYVQARTGLPLDWLYAAVRRFHAPSQVVLAPSQNVFHELTARGFERVRHWAHGVDTTVFRPDRKNLFDLPRPIFLYVGRVTVDKNLTAFLDLDLPGSKVVVGSGPQREALKKAYPQALFHIAEGDEELRLCFNAGDVFVFPSRTDTFGLVMLEALACGVPVAAFPVTGPQDVLLDAAGTAGILDTDLKQAALTALTLDPADCRAHALRFGWDEVARQFLEALAPIRYTVGEPATESPHVPSCP
ncbi:glycosyltransferase family 4 protein [Novispirillum itersonii]|uniref:Glycosyltransferase involved in cell wall biosynthesis n=1 Tax=Novispirillum itersonii TaxID=189 RepID=A0A7W9ZDY5_NOVIT|nr:glycosyltransferase family 1 protein [Novispirillum itersonii]MBB6209620.1 glycosyltransferase involved in cell wall biosynthesis [Novispirillum itersonii]